MVTFRLSASLSLASFLLMTSTGFYPPAHAQTVAPTTQKVVLSADDLTSFSKTLEILHQQTGYVIVAEGSPLASRVNPTFPRLPLRPIETNLVGEGLRQAAAVFDYSVETVGNIAYFKKRFANPEDLPCVAPEECLASLQIIEANLGQFNPNVPSRKTIAENHPLIKDLAPLLSAAEIKSMQSDEGLPAKSLSPAQHRLVERFAHYLYIQNNLTPISNAAVLLNRISEIRLGYGEFDGERQFGYYLPRITQGPGPAAFQGFSRHNELVMQPPTKTGSEAEKPATNESEEEKSPYLSSLQEIVRQLNQKASTTKHAYSVSEMLARKNITVVGLDQATPDNLLLSIARIYGLAVTDTIDSESKKPVPEISRKRSRKAANINELDATIRVALPEPLIRDIFYTPSEEDKELVNQLLLSEERDPQRPAAKNHPIAALARANTERILAAQNDQQRPAKIWQAAGSLLEQSFLRQNKDSKTTDTLSYSQLTDDEKNALALVLMIPALNKIKTAFLGKPPVYITKMEEASLKGGTYQDESGKPMFSLMFCFPDSKGKLAPKAGMFGLSYTSP